MSTLSAEVKIHLFYGVLIVFYLVVTVVFFWILSRIKTRSYIKSIENYRDEYLNLIDQLNYVASENMVSLEEKTLELQKLLDRIKKERLAVEEILEEIRFLKGENSAFLKATDSLPKKKLFEEKAKKIETHIPLKENSPILEKNVLEDVFSRVEEQFHRKRPSFFKERSDERLTHFHSSPLDFLEEPFLKSTPVSSSVKNKNEEKYHKVLKLYNEGYSVEQIMEMTGMSKGAINLLLAFNKKGSLLK